MFGIAAGLVAGRFGDRRGRDRRRGEVVHRLVQGQQAETARTAEDQQARIEPRQGEGDQARKGVDMEDVRRFGQQHDMQGEPEDQQSRRAGEIVGPARQQRPVVARPRHHPQRDAEEQCEETPHGIVDEDGIEKPDRLVRDGPAENVRVFDGETRPALGREARKQQTDHRQAAQHIEMIETPGLSGMFGGDGMSHDAVSSRDTPVSKQQDGCQRGKWSGRRWRRMNNIEPPGGKPAFVRAGLFTVNTQRRGSCCGREAPAKPAKRMIPAGSETDGAATGNIDKQTGRRKNVFQVKNLPIGGVDALGVRVLAAGSCGSSCSYQLEQPKCRDGRDGDARKAATHRSHRPLGPIGAHRIPKGV